MRIVNLIENTEGRPGCVCKHGLSFYIETAKHCLISDLGPSEDTIENARILGVDLKAVDTVILSHGHYDHSGGIMPFTEQNKCALIYMQKAAVDMHYSYDADKPEGERYRYNGIDRRIPELPQVKLLDGDLEIDDELSILTVKGRKYPIPFANSNLLVKKGEGYQRDEFDHEQSLVIKEDSMRVLISGCAHMGILNIMEAFREKYRSDPDVVISGFHLMKKTDYSAGEIEEIKAVAEGLLNYNSRFITCHCTSVAAYEIMKEIMGEKLSYVHSGEEFMV